MLKGKGKRMEHKLATIHTIILIHKWIEKLFNVNKVRFVYNTYKIEDKNVHKNNLKNY